MPYQPIEDYGIIGNMKTVALVSKQGSIDWYCYPHFDSPSVFGSILDDRRGGYFKIQPFGINADYKQFYWPDTNILVTRFYSEAGIVEIEDFMPILRTDRAYEHHQIIRRVRCVRGQMGLELDCSPAFDYGRSEHEVTIEKHGVGFRTPELSLALETEVPLERGESRILARFILKEGETQTFRLRQIKRGDPCSQGLTHEEAQREFKETVEYWRRWLGQCTYQGRWRENVQRSALALKLLTFKPTGAIIAAATCSLPETMGGGRNWDYRYAWLRDAAFTVYGFLRIGFTEEAMAFMEWVEQRCRERQPHEPLRIMYSVSGSKDIPEIELPHWEGYRGSRPVRVGNDASHQLQLDIYGEVMDAVYLYNKHVVPIGYDFWKRLREVMHWLEKNWNQPDEGIWETRGGRKHFTYSKLMCWVAFDRAIRLSEKRSFPAPWHEWRQTRDKIYEEIMARSWCERRQSFVQSYDSENLDAANLIMPLVFFLSPNDPRLLSTIEAFNRSPSQGGLVSDGLIYRYNADHFEDGLQGQEGTFNMCTFWLVEALTRAAKRDPYRLDQARLLFERMLGYGNHLGLYAEQTGPNGKMLGNFPQAFTHLALISSAVNLDLALKGKKH
jgi:GH15 family glucan-1,4-alpha-glucosidase